jgi:hypothetical protein
MLSYTDSEDQNSIILPHIGGFAIGKKNEYLWVGNRLMLFIVCFQGR